MNYLPCATSYREEEEEKKHRIPESEVPIMEKSKNPIYYPEIMHAAEMSCTLCGKHSEVRFKHGFVCEDCLNYVKTNC